MLSMMEHYYLLDIISSIYLISLSRICYFHATSLYCNPHGRLGVTYQITSCTVSRVIVYTLEWANALLQNCL